jgi:HK97 family phage prohead protease
MDLLRFTPNPVTIDAAAPDGTPRRTIMGLAAPYGVEATTMDGTRVRFAPGSLPTDGRAPKLLQYHDTSRPIGVVTSRIEVLDGDAPGMYFEARISSIPAGDDALTLAMDGVLDAVSVGIVPSAWTYDENNVMVVTASRWDELSMVPLPAFDSSRIHQIAAQAGNNEEQQDPDARDDDNEPQQENPNMEHVENPATVEAATPVTPLWAAARAASPKLPTPAEYVAAFSAGSSAFAEMNARISAAAPNITTTETPGILPEIITGSVFDGLNPIRPFVSAIGSRAMPSAGATFRRPKIGTRPVVTQQPTGQLNTLSASEVTVTNADISKLSFGTYVTVSEQDLDWSDPASINIILEQLAIAYGQATDNYAVDTMLAAVTQTENVTDDENPKDWLAAIYGAAYQISVASNYLPTHFICDPVAWYKLGKLTATDGTPSFPFVGAPGLGGYNAMGTQAATSWNGSPLGLTMIVDKNMTANSAVVGHAAGPAAGFEFYEQQKGAISVDVPSTLGRTIAFRGYAAAYMADATKFVKLVIPS